MELSHSLADVMSADQINKFWSYVQKSLDPNDCWLWTRYKDKDGYGNFGVGVGSGRRSARCHRIAWELTYGKIPQGMYTLHRCDVPACVNPFHLWLGTNADNVADRDSKGRGSRVGNKGLVKGVRNGRAKLTDQDIEQIKNLYQTGSVTQKQLGQKFGVGQSQINRILQGKLWNSGKAAMPKYPKNKGDFKGELNARAKITAMEVTKIRCLYKAGSFSYSTLADMFGIDKSTVASIIKRKIWRDVE